MKLTKRYNIHLFDFVYQTTTGSFQIGGCGGTVLPRKKIFDSRHKKQRKLDSQHKNVLSDQVKGYLTHFDQRDQKSWEVRKTAKQLISRKVLF